MQPGFVIMQIGNPELDAVYEQAVAPALESCGFEARRVDRHNRGGLLVSEIIGFIEEAELVVADLTHERPNCYLEVGYVFGVGKLTNLILTARADHDPENPSHRPGGRACTSTSPASTSCSGSPSASTTSARAREADPAAPGAAHLSELRAPSAGASPWPSRSRGRRSSPRAPARQRPGRRRVGGTAPYRVNGKTYVPLRDWQGYAEEGVASWYGAAHHGQKTANGERFDAYGARRPRTRPCPSTSAPRSRTSAPARACSCASTTAAPSRRAA